MARKRPVPSGLRIKDLTFSGIPARVYEPTAASGEKKRGLVYFHGGGGWCLAALVIYTHKVKDCRVDSFTCFHCLSDLPQMIMIKCVSIFHWRVTPQLCLLSKVTFCILI